MNRMGKGNMSIQEMIVYALVPLMALALKYGFARAGSGGLLWVLAPTACLAEALTGIPFVHEPPLGFINTAHGIIIAPVCSGINFLILSLCMVFFSFAGRHAGPGRKLRWLALSVIVAYAATVGVNAVRIAISMPLICNDVHYGWLTPERVHRMTGIFVYCSGLFGLYFVMDCVPGRVHRKENSWYRKNNIILAPLFWYLLITVGVPLVTGSYRAYGERFTEHAVTVLALSGAILGVLTVIRSLVMCEDLPGVKSKGRGNGT